MPYYQSTDDLLTLTNPEVRRAFENVLLPSESDRTNAHLVLAGNVNMHCITAVCIPTGDDLFHVIQYINLYCVILQLVCGHRLTSRAPTPFLTVRPIPSGTCLPHWLVNSNFHTFNKMCSVCASVPNCIDVTVICILGSICQYVF